MRKKEDQKGFYRSIYSSIWDDPDFRKLNLNEKIVLLNLRTSPLSNLPCIFLFYFEAIEKQTGLSHKAVQQALDTLCDTLWVRVEDGVCWVRNGLKYDPNISLSNPKHIESIRKTIVSLPKLQIVLDFCEYYKIEIPYTIPYANGYHIPYGNQSILNIQYSKEKRNSEKNRVSLEIQKKAEELLALYPKISDPVNSTKSILKLLINPPSELLPCPLSGLKIRVREYVKAIEEKGTEKEFIIQSNNFFGKAARWRETFRERNYWDE